MSPSPELPDYERIARELIRAARGRRSCAELSRRAGYRSNMVHRWEAGQCWPSASAFLKLHARLRPVTRTWIESFFHERPSWVEALDPTSPAAVAAFLRHLRGRTPVVRIAALAQCNRYSISRWLAGSTEPRLPDFLRIVDASSRRLLDLIAALEDPARLPALRERWQQQQLARKAAYDLPWSHAVLRALELADSPRGLSAQHAFIARKLGISSDKVRAALHLLEAMAQVKKTRGRFVPREVAVVDTGSDPARAHELRLAWTETALERLRARAPGHYGWSLFAVSKADIARLNNLHLQYVRAMREVIASSTNNECVGLYCAQLLDLGAEAS
jgi:transcriptional regulator with XRE-family HTH domain